MLFPVLKSFGLVHEGLEAGQCIGLLLAVIRHIEDGDVAVFLTIPFKQRTDNRSRHAGEGHNIDNSAGAPFGKIDRLSYGKNGFPLEGAGRYTGSLS